LPSAVALAERIAWLLHSANHARRVDDIPMGVVSVIPVRDPEFLVIEITLACSGAIDAPDEEG
jgi:hypothetical protein